LLVSNPLAAAGVRNVLNSAAARALHPDYTGTSQDPKLGAPVARRAATRRPGPKGFRTLARPKPDA